MTQWRRPLDFERFQHQPIFIHSIFHLVLCTVIPPRLAPASGHLRLTEKVAGRHFVTDSVAQEARFSSGFLDDVRFGWAVFPGGSSVTPEVALTSTGARLSTRLVVSEFNKMLLLFCFSHISDPKRPLEGHLKLWYPGSFTLSHQDSSSCASVGWLVSESHYFSFRASKFMYIAAPDVHSGQKAPDHPRVV